MANERFARRKWLNKLHFPFPVHTVPYAYGHNLGTVKYLWKIPADGPSDQTAIVHALVDLTSQQIKYSTRALRRDFLLKYSRLTKNPKSILRNIYRTLLSDGSAASCQVEAEIDNCVAKAILEINDPQIILDLRYESQCIPF